MRAPDVIVLGVGAVGAATCSALARRGVAVVGIERFEIAHENGSSGGRTRLIRKAYFEHPDYVPLLHRAYDGWDALAERTGERVLDRCGCVFAGPPESELIRGTREAAARHGLAVEEPSPRQVVERWPALTLPADFAVIWEPDAGYVACDRAIARFADDARAHGAEIRTGETVVAWREEGAGVRVTTDRGEIAGGHLVITAGPWTARVATELGVGLRVTRQPLCWIEPCPPEPHRRGALPCWAVEDPAAGFGGLLYGFPLLDDGTGGVKVGHHDEGPAADPDTLDRRASPDELAAPRRAVARYLPGVSGPVVASTVCMYTMSDDGHFVVDRHPGLEHVSVACGLSGHGFKFAPVLGEILADLATTGSAIPEAGFLGVSRFRGGRPRGARRTSTG